MRKAVTKRIKITRTGKLIRRRAGQNHFNAKQSRRIQLGKRKTEAITGPMEKKFRAYMIQK